MNDLQYTECTECGDEAELRPYGKNGAMVCFFCAMKDEQEAKRQFGMQLEAASDRSDIVVICEQTGPRPLGGRTS